MKKRMLLMSILASLALFACTSKEPISEKEAIKIALDEAGVKENDASFTKQAFDKEDNEYSFAFSSKDTKYEYDISGDGKILS